MQNTKKTNKPIIRKMLYGQTDKWTNWTILARFQASKDFSKNFGSVSFGYLWSTNFIQNIKKTNQPILRKVLHYQTNEQIGPFWAFLAHFRASKNFLKKFGFASFQDLWSLTFIQNAKKILCANSEKNAVIKNESTYGRTDIGPAQSVDPKRCLAIIE